MIQVPRPRDHQRIVGDGDVEVALSVDRHTKADFIGELDRMRGAASGADKEWIGKLKAVAVRW